MGVKKTLIRLFKKVGKEQNELAENYVGEAAFPSIRVVHL